MIKNVLCMMLIAGVASAGSFDFYLSGGVTTNSLQLLERVTDDSWSTPKTYPGELYRAKPSARPQRETGTTNVIDEITGETNTVTLYEVIPVADLTLDDGLREMTEGEKTDRDAHNLAISDAMYATEIATLCSTNTYRDVIYGTYTALNSFTNLSIVDDGFAGIMTKANEQVADATGDDKGDKLAAILMAKTLFLEYLKPAGIEGQKLQDCIEYVLTH